MEKNTWVFANESWACAMVIRANKAVKLLQNLYSKELITSQDFQEKMDLALYVLDFAKEVKFQAIDDCSDDFYETFKAGSERDISRVESFLKWKQSVKNTFNQGGFKNLQMQLGEPSKRTAKTEYAFVLHGNCTTQNASETF